MNPAHTLAAASCMVTSLTPISLSNAHPASANRFVLGSVATKTGASCRGRH